MKKEVVRRSLYIPKALDQQVELMVNKFSASTKNKMYVELIELGILKFNEDMSLKNMIVNAVNKMDSILEKIK